MFIKTLSGGMISQYIVIRVHRNATEIKFTNSSPNFNYAPCSNSYVETRHDY